MTMRCVPLPRTAGRVSAELISAVRRSKDVRFEEGELLSCAVKRCDHNRKKVEWSLERGPGTGSRPGVVDHL